MKPQKAIIDCPDRNPDKFREFLLGNLKLEVELVLEHKADLNYPTVAEASILAKVTRDNIIEKMKKGVTIINTARGAVIDTEDIITGLENGTIGALGIDVYENEHDLFFKDHSHEIVNDDYIIKLNAMPNVLITGHHAFLTDEALTNIAETVIYNLDCYGANKNTENELTNILTEVTPT